MLGVFSPHINTIRNLIIIKCYLIIIYEIEQLHMFLFNQKAKLSTAD